MKICVADDEKEVRESIIRKLESLFPHDDVYDVSFGHRALELLRTVRPDLVFLDIRMPEMDGLEILGSIKQAVPTVQVVILSGYDDFEYARKALQRGAADYLLKPADREELRRVVHGVREQMTIRFREELDDLLYKLSEEYVFIHDIRYGNAGLWFDERQSKRIWIGDAERDSPEPANRERDVLIEFRVNQECRGVVAAETERDASPFRFAEKREFVKTLTEAIGKWESRRFFGGETDHLPNAKVIAGKESAMARQRILHAAKAGDLAALQTALDDWLERLGRMELNALKTECVNLMALLDEGLARNDGVFILDEEKRHYWWQWVSKHKTWAELKTVVRRFVVGGVRALKQLEEQPGNWFEQALQWIDRSKDPNLNLESVAEAVGVHPVTLSRLFKQQTGLNFVKHLARRRLQNAQTLLLKTNKKINEIAEEVGYVDYRYFRTLFKKEFGITPSEYRSRNGIQPGPSEPEDGG